MILLIDNYDSFVHNLARYFVRLGQQTRVVRNDEIRVEEIAALRPQAIVISPGPCTPAESGCSLDVIRHFVDRIPLLGVCLGHQALAAALGARIVRATAPMHGRTSAVHHDGSGIFQDVPDPVTVCRYHSLIVEEASLPSCLRVTARTTDGTIMAVQHRQQCAVGVQFHPEALLTDGGYTMLANFLRMAGQPLPQTLPRRADELTEEAPRAFPLPGRPVTF